MNEDIDGQEIQSESQEPTFYARIPNMVLEDLDPYALSLYCQYKRIAAEKGKCYMSNRSLAQRAHMSVRRLMKARAELVHRHLISVTEQRDEATGVINQPPVVVIRDIWAINHQRFAISDETGERVTRKRGVARRATPLAPNANPLALSATKEEPDKEEQEKEIAAPKKRAARAPNPNEPLHHALMLAMGTQPGAETKRNDTKFWMAAADCAKVGVTPEMVPDLVAYVLSA